MQICTPTLVVEKAKKMKVMSIPLTMYVDNEENFLLAARLNGISYTTIKPLHSSQCCRERGERAGKEWEGEREGEDTHAHTHTHTLTHTIAHKHWSMLFRQRGKMRSLK